MPDSPDQNRLTRNFHRTFKPERQYIHALLRFAASGREGDAQAIAAATGIPTGASTGKVPAILDYCRGMGLVKLGGQDRSATKKPELTPFGRVVLLEDPFLKMGVTQWIAHFNLCSPLTGADVWYHTFFPGTQSLGMTFPRAMLEEHLSRVYGAEKSGLIGPMIGTYEDDAALHVCGALSEGQDAVTRKPAPISEEYGLGYGAWILQLMATHFPTSGQVSAANLDSKAGWRTIPGWDIAGLQKVLDLVERKGVLEVDRQMEPWLLRPTVAGEELWKRLYDDLI